MKISMKVLPNGSLQIEWLGILTRKSLTQRLLEICRRDVTKEESLQQWPAPLFFCRHSSPVGSHQRKDAGLDRTSPSREQIFCSLFTCHWYALLFSDLSPHNAPVPGLLKRVRKHRGTLLLMRSSMAAAGNPCRHMCCAQRSREQQHPALLPSLPSSTCNWNSRNLSPTVLHQKGISIPWSRGYWGQAMPWWYPSQQWAHTTHVNTSMCM